MLFASGKRPNPASIREFAEAQRTTSLTFDPFADRSLQLIAAEGEKIGQDRATPADKDQSVWVELLRDALTFDLLGLAPGPMPILPAIEYRYDFDQSPNSLRLEGLHLLPGKHLAGGANSIPVMRAMIGLACDFIHHFSELVAVAWAPAKSVIGRRYFESVGSAWLDGGAFPALGLTSFRSTVDGALQTVGLEFWIGQELRIEPPLSNNKVEATRLGVRLVNQLVLIGGLDKSERLTAPDGSRLIMGPSRNGKFVRVARE
ncbi:hypothetical protein FGU71_13250 [Erythrobacter insulae]|uniref:DUF4261 domain-containing protein n=1 Tax=Erythrobacter insulae TaxID=2584124 RepID=A0A547P754_9SPHN|nr:hypothetical protein [Erythrobacter insulae]TRD09965.1 hypothetical protein FGU71_13250 [Erythrobacter insulae]